MKNQTNLTERWITFVKIIFDPWILLASVALILLIRSGKNADIAFLRIILTILVALLSMIIGGLFIKKWMDIHNEKTLVLRGKLSIRSLKLLYFNLIQTENRTEKYIRKLKESDSNYELVKSNFEDIIEKCILLEEECINSIESWADIIEEANVKNIISKVKFLKAEIEKLEAEIGCLEKEVIEEIQAGDETGKDMVNQIEQKKNELNELRNQLLEKERKINASILSGMTGSYLPKDTIYSIYKCCPSCGSFYSGSYLCPFCGAPIAAGIKN